MRRKPSTDKRACSSAGVSPRARHFNCLLGGEQRRAVGGWTEVQPGDLEPFAPLTQLGICRWKWSVVKAETGHI